MGIAVVFAGPLAKCDSDIETLLFCCDTVGEVVALCKLGDEGLDMSPPAAAGGDDCAAVLVCDGLGPALPPGGAGAGRPGLVIPGIVCIPTPTTFPPTQSLHHSQPPQLGSLSICVIDAFVCILAVPEHFSHSFVRYDIVKS